jgi:hypothetical protein
MEFIFEIADKHRDRVWVKYPRTFKSKESAEDFKKRFLEAAPAWRLARITEVIHFSANAESSYGRKEGNDAN